MKIAVVRETTPGETRVAATPETVKKFIGLGAELAVETGAGDAASISDTEFEGAGAAAGPREKVLAGADIILCINGPDAASLKGAKQGALLVGALDPTRRREAIDSYASAGFEALAMEWMPRITRAQSMDILSSQSNLAGYKAVVDGAATYGRAFPMMMTAAGTVSAARVFVMGVGVAGLQAIATARRLGAQVSATDVRSATKEQIQSLGAKPIFVENVAGIEGEGAGGYARTLTADEQAAQQRALVDAIRDFDVVITTAQVPGHRPPELVPAAALAAMAPGSVVVDLAAGPLGGNVAGSSADGRTETENGVVVLGAGNLPAQLPRAASHAWARNLASVLEYLTQDGSVVLDPDDEITAGLLVHPKETVS